MRMSSNGRAPASQAGDAGSIPVIRSNKLVAKSLDFATNLFFSTISVDLLFCEMSCDMENNAWYFLHAKGSACYLRQSLEIFFAPAWPRYPTTWKNFLYGRDINHQTWRQEADLISAYCRSQNERSWAALRYRWLSEMRHIQEGSSVLSRLPRNTSR